MERLIVAWRKESKAAKTDTPSRCPPSEFLYRGMSDPFNVAKNGVQQSRRNPNGEKTGMFGNTENQKNNFRGSKHG
jgi:hypothetical protein